MGENKMAELILKDGQVLESIYKDVRTGKQCIVILNPFGYRLGYVEYSNKVPLELVDDRFLASFLRTSKNNKNSLVNCTIKLTERRFPLVTNLNVHGGITFSGEKEISISGDTLRVVGFDCAHFNDCPDKGSMLKYFGKDDERYKLVTKLGRDKGHIWTLNEVKEECESLAKQVDTLEKSYLKQKKIELKRAWKGQKRKSWNKRK